MEDFVETCRRCGYMSSNELCKACSLLEGLERGVAAAGIVSSADLLLGADPIAHTSRLIERERKWTLKDRLQKACGRYPTFRCPRARGRRR